MTSEKTLNEVFSATTARRRYEVWFIRLGLADGSGAWWFRYLLMNPGLPSPADNPGMPVQVWATWFPTEARPITVIQKFSLADLELSAKRQQPFHFRVLNNEISENSCRGNLNLGENHLSWQLNYRSTFRVTLSDKGWIGFSRTPHSDAMFSGQITFNGQTVEGNPLGYGLQGHNCGYKHRKFWVWTHAYFPGLKEATSTLEALVYDMPFGVQFRKAVLWHRGRRQIFRNFKEVARDRENFRWRFRASTRDGEQMEFFADTQGPNIHRLAYEKTDGSGSFEVLNNSLARAQLVLRHPDGPSEELHTARGAVLEMGGDTPRIGTYGDGS